MVELREKVLDFVSGMRMLGSFNAHTEGCQSESDTAADAGKVILDLKKEAAISDEGVDYSRTRDSAAYRRLASVLYPCLAAFDLSRLATPQERKAFWINLYHLLTIDAVIRFGISHSVTEGLLGGMRFFHKAAYTVGGLRFSLDDIEHGILRANRGVIYLPGSHFAQNDARRAYCLEALDARIHFALNCASRSCPPIAFYSPEDIDRQLDQSAGNFIDNEVKMDKSGVALHIPRVFKWYRSDFGGKYGVLEWIHRYLPEKDERRLLIDHFDYQTMTILKKYDWGLNKGMKP